jgi:molybdopterin converting factor small subunit
MMEITVRLLASYRHLLPEDHDVRAGFRQEVPSECRVADVLAGLPIPPGDSFTCLVNGRHAERDQCLTDGDTVSIFPAAGGG